MIDSDNLPDNVYYDVNINYGDNVDHRASYINFSTSIILKDPSKYYLALARYYIPISNVPLMSQFPILGGPTQTNPNLSTLSVTLGYNGNYSPETRLLWVSTDLSIPTPNPPSVNPPTYTPTPSPYYFVYDYTQFLNCVNTALSSAFATLPGAPVGALAPYMIYDPSTKLFSLVCQTAFYNQTLATPISIYFNNDLHTYFLSISVIKQPTNVLGRDFLINIRDLGNNFYNPPFLAPTIPPAYFIMTQNYATTNAFNDLLGLSIETNTLPVRKEVSQVNNNNGVVTYRPVLSNFNILYSGTDEPRSAVQYFAQLYRLIDMNSREDINRIDINIQYYTKNNVYYPIIIDANEVCTVKLLFVKKSLYKEIQYSEDMQKLEEDFMREGERERKEEMRQGKGRRRITYR